MKIPPSTVKIHLPPHLFNLVYKQFRNPSTKTVLARDVIVANGGYDVNKVLDNGERTSRVYRTWTMNCLSTAMRPSHETTMR